MKPKASPLHVVCRHFPSFAANILIFQLRKQRYRKVVEELDQVHTARMWGCSQIQSQSDSGFLLSPLEGDGC